MKKKKNSIKLLIASVMVALVAIAAIWGMGFVYNRASEPRMIYLYPNTSQEAFADTLRNNLGKPGEKAWTLMKLLGVDLNKRVGAYRIEEGATPIEIARRIRNGQQTPVKFTFNNVRTVEQFAERVSERLLISKEEMLQLLGDEQFCAKYGQTPATMPAILFPDSYEYYWNVKAERLIDDLASYSKRFWNDDRRRKAESLGLTPEEVVTVASIAEEESAKRDERGKIGRLYINRLQSGMPLQADPTVKFAIGDFGIRRITVEMTKYDSPYNTYRYAGLPPGPIRFVEKATIDNILNSEPTNYIYMCAKEDFSGYHNFAATYAEHCANARRYHIELNKRGIK